MDGISRVYEQQPICKVTTVIKEDKTSQHNGLSCMFLAMIFQIVLTHGQWPFAWLYSEAEGQ